MDKVKRGQKRSFSLCNLFLKNHKGLSTIVITLIIILLSLVAIGIIWFVVNNIISEGSNQVGFGQLLINLDITDAFEQEGNIVVDVTRKSGEEELVKIKFVLSDDENSEVIEKESTLAKLESDRFFINPTLLIATEIKTVSVAPVFKLEDESESTGEITDTYNVGASSGSEIDDESCVPECGELECGVDPECGQSCGTCGGTDTCANGVCVASDCTPETKETTCGAWLCGTKINNCGAEIDCGICPDRQMCQEGTACIEITPVNIGKVEETWPGTSGIYFGSSDLPVDVSYEDYYIEFLNSDETNCRLITIYKFPVDGYEKSHVGFNFETLIKISDDYQIWETIEKCQA